MVFLCPSFTNIDVMVTIRLTIVIDYDYNSKKINKIIKMPKNIVKFKIDKL